jgi:hypothetical protein
MKNIFTFKIVIFFKLIICLLCSESVHGTATQKKCDDGWKSSPASKVCTGSVQEDPSDRRTCLLQNVTCNGVSNGSLSIQPHQFPNLNVCSDHLTIGTCSASAPTQQACQTQWDNNPASKSCSGGVGVDPSDPTLCQLAMTCNGTNNGTLTYSLSQIAQLQICDGLLKTGVCKSK